MKRIISLFFIVFIYTSSCAQWNTTSITGPIYRNGNVGIGMSSNPISLFQVAAGGSKIAMGSCNTGSPYWMANYFGFNIAKNSLDSWVLESDGANNGGTGMLSTPGGSIHFLTIPSTGNSTQTFTNSTITNNIKMSIRADGKVGIGNWNYGAWDSGYRLYVAYGIVTEKIKIASQVNWPDFVFEPTYYLKSLSEIENYIKEHKHLEGIPSAKEVKEKGYVLNDIQGALLQKIEEMTLLMINQQKEIEQLKAQVYR